MADETLNIVNTRHVNDIVNTYGEVKFEDIVCTHISNGGSLIDLARLWDVKYSHLLSYVNRSETLRERYKAAKDDKREYTKDLLLNQLMGFAAADIRDCFDTNGAVKPLDQWPYAIAQSITSMEVNETLAKGSEGELDGYVKKFKLVDKLKAIETLGRELGLFVQKQEVKTEVSFADLVNQSYNDARDITPEDKQLVEKDISSGSTQT